MHPGHAADPLLIVVHGKGLGLQGIVMVFFAITGGLVLATGGAALVSSNSAGP
jgi:hypothetical protein